MNQEAPDNVVPFPSKLEQRAIRCVDVYLEQTGLSVEKLFEFSLWFDGMSQKLRSAFISELYRRKREALK